MELTILMPCLNEAKTVVACVKQAQDFLLHNEIDGEVLVADNGSSDGSQGLAIAAGARVISVHRRGYGCAITAGISAARGQFVVVGDADQSYDFSKLSNFVEKLREGFDLVMGDRFAGGIEDGAMPILHRYLGNPVLSFVGRLFFRLRVKDFHCGLRAFRKESILKLGLSAPGMEFASEMVVKAALSGLSVAEVPTTLAPDRRDRPPHLRTWRDGWRHLRFLLMFSPRWLFLYPGLILLLFGGGAQGVLFFGQIEIGNIAVGVHTMLYAAAISIIGFQMIWFGLIARWLGSLSGVMPIKGGVEKAFSAWTLERGLVLGLILGSAGLMASIDALLMWRAQEFGPLYVDSVMRMAIVSVTLMVAGGEAIVVSFLVGVLKSYVGVTDNSRETVASGVFVSDLHRNKSDA